jgi:thioredoxin-related protein
MIMKRLAFSIVFFILLSNVRAQLSPQSADEILKQAYGQAVKENKNVFIIFHASWCVWCHRMDSSMNDKACKNFFDDNFIIRHLTVSESKDKKNFENPGADDLRKKYHGDDQGIPFWLIFDKEGKLLADSRMKENNIERNNVGCPANEKEVEYFIKTLRQTSGISEQQIELIRNRFRQNEH